MDLHQSLRADQRLSATLAGSISRSIREASESKKTTLLVLLWLGLLFCLLPGMSLAAADRKVNNQIIIKYRTPGKPPGHTVRPQRLLSQLKTPQGMPLTFRRRMSGNSMVAQLPEGLTDEQVQDALDTLAQDPAVEYAQRDKRMYPALVPNDPRYSEQWYLFEAFGINMQNAWDISTGSAGIVIAVLDTGVVTHSDLDTSRILTTQGIDLISDLFTANDGDGRDLDPSDPGDAVDPNDPGDQVDAPADCLNDPVNHESSWHGLSVVGVIAATADNNSFVAGIDFKARILPVRVLGKCGGLISDIVDGMRWAVGLPVAGVPDNTNPARVINLSLAGDGTCSPAEQDAINTVRAKGAVVVTAAGNEAEDMDIVSKSPANCQGVIAVGATSRSGDRASYANFGSAVDLAAPGGDDSDGVRTLSNTGIQAPENDASVLIQGTSFTTAQVSAVASLVYAANSSLTPDSVEGILCATTQPFPAGSSCSADDCGTGILDAAAALTAAQNPASVLPASCATNSAPPPAKTGGGGGCVLNESRVFDPIWLLFLQLVLLYSRRSLQAFIHG